MATLGRFFRQHFLHRRPRLQAVHPRSEVLTLRYRLVDHPALVNVANRSIPRHEAQVRIAALIPDQVLLALQGYIQHLCDADDFLLVALDGAGEFLGVEVSKPGALSEVGSLAGGLEV